MFFSQNQETDIQGNVYFSLENKWYFQNMF